MAGAPRPQVRVGFPYGPKQPCRARAHRKPARIRLQEAGQHPDIGPAAEGPAPRDGIRRGFGRGIRRRNKPNPGAADTERGSGQSRYDPQAGFPTIPVPHHPRTGMAEQTGWDQVHIISIPCFISCDASSATEFREISAQVQMDPKIIRLFPEIGIIGGFLMDKSFPASWDRTSHLDALHRIFIRFMIHIVLMAHCRPHEQRAPSNRTGDFR